MSLCVALCRGKSDASAFAKLRSHYVAFIRFRESNFCACICAPSSFIAFVCVAPSFPRDAELSQSRDRIFQFSSLIKARWGPAAEKIGDRSIFADHTAVRNTARWITSDSKFVVLLRSGSYTAMYNISIYMGAGEIPRARASSSEAKSERSVIRRKRGVVSRSERAKRR